MDEKTREYIKQLEECVLDNWNHFSTFGHDCRYCSGFFFDNKHSPDCIVKLVEAKRRER